MTWIETLILIAFGGVVGGFLFRRHPLARGISLVSTVVLVTLLLVFGDEFLSHWLSSRRS
jgi:hypothetical protein